MVPLEDAPKPTQFHVPQSPAAIERSVEAMVQGMADILNGDPGMYRFGGPGDAGFLDLTATHWQDKEHILAAVAEGIIGRDMLFLVESEGRPRTGTEERKSDLADPFLSHICEYGIKGKTTGLPEYDQLFAEIMGYLKKQVEPDLLKQVIQAYNKKHPGTEAHFEGLEL